MASQEPPTSPDSADPDVALLRSVYPPHLFGPRPSSTSPGKPFLTLTYAQSLDGKIAGPGGKQIRLSGEESMRLTHRLRELHDSILVGVGTVLNDDPQLTARLPDLLPLAEQPTPVILDTNLRTPPSCKLIANARKGIGRTPTIVCGFYRDGAPQEEMVAQYVRKTRLEADGAKFVQARRDSSSASVSLPSLLSTPSDPTLFGRSLMVEGGASVITSFLASGLVDLVIVTVAPVLVGAEGVSVTQPGIKIPILEHLRTEVYGKDTVFVCKPLYDVPQ
ncbi:hypothetical protein JCM8547_002478 [Rhodosporidiobolus lusitaniae]